MYSPLLRMYSHQWKQKFCIEVFRNNLQELDSLQILPMEAQQYNHHPKLVHPDI